MPELPEVETVARGLREPLIGRRVTGMWQDWMATIHSPPPDQFAARIAGQRIQSVGRRGKYILIALEHDTLLIHLKMSGRLYVAGKAETQDADRWVHVRFDLDDGRQLRFSDVRKFGRVYLSDAVDDLLAHLGPEPFGTAFDAAYLLGKLAGRKRSIKALLLDQEIVAGVGNIYADEALFRAGIHPGAPGGALDEGDAARLISTVRAALQAGIDHEGASINWYRKADGGKGASQDHFFVYGREKEACRRCGGPISKIRLAQRGTHYCPVCQPERTVYPPRSPHINVGKI